MDRRTIDWKQSARHMKLLAKNYRSERNSQIVFAVDSGRQMCDPIAGLPRVDRCVSAMLLTGWIALKLGDRVSIHAFNSRPRLSSGLVSGSGAFTELERIAAQIDYSGDETNYTFALTTLSAKLTRRSMIILFTELTNSLLGGFPAPGAQENGADALAAGRGPSRSGARNRSSSASRKLPTTSPGQLPRRHC